MRERLKERERERWRVRKEVREYEKREVGKNRAKIRERGRMLKVAQPYLRRHVVCNAKLQVLQDALHGVVRLLLGGPEVLLHGTGHGCKDGLGCLPGVHHLPGVLLLLFLQPLNVSEGLLHCHHKPGGQEGSGPDTYLLSSPPPKLQSSSSKNKVRPFCS